MSPQTDSRGRTLSTAHLPPLQPPLHIAITTGEPAGVGPELTAQALAASVVRWPDVHWTILSDATLFAQRAQQVNIDWAALAANKNIHIAHQPLVVPALAGTLNTQNGRYVLALLDAAIDGALVGQFDAIVTAPLQKSTINDAGVPFTGHTEYLAQRTGTARVVMMLASTEPQALRVALATTHIPLNQVAAALTIPLLTETLAILNHDLQKNFGLPSPRILVAGLNPHAGESGYLGREEIEIITPALQYAVTQGIDARGPYPADTLFQPRYLQSADCVLSMFHDQGLPVLKYATFGTGVNITLGLPIIRTSVDHGTALDLAGTGRAQPHSLIAAIHTAIAMAHHKRCT